MAEEELVVVDGGEVPLDQQHLERVGELVRVRGVVVAQEGGGLSGIPADPLDGGRAGMSACRHGLSAMSRVHTAAPRALERAAPAR
ncbi:hypothetical protein ACNFR7_04935 [Streptomyces sp. RM1]